MFFPGSRYAGLGTYTVQAPDGTTRTATFLPLPRRRPIVGPHRRLEGQSLDLIAFRYLADEHGFHHLCDASGTMSPDTLAAAELVAIPVKGK